MRLRPSPGIVSDAPPASGNDQRWAAGFNVRWRNAMVETIGLWRKALDLAGNPIQVPVSTHGPVRTILPTSRGDGAQVLLGALNGVFVMRPDPSSTLSTGTRWALDDITPEYLDYAPAADTIGPDLGRVRVGPFWWFAEFGRRVVMARSGLLEPMFVWDRNPSHLAEPVDEAPRKSVGAVVTDNAFLVMLGVEPVAGDDPAELNIRWANQGTFNQWTPGPTTSAGDFLISSGSRIVGGGTTSLGGFAWTDRGPWSIRPLYDTTRFIEVARVGEACGLMANRAWCETDGRLWWLGTNKSLWLYEGGRPQSLGCTIKNDTLDRITREGTHRMSLSPSAEHDEVVIHCPTGASHEVDRQAVYNWRERCWSRWSLPRTAMCDRLGALRPIAVDAAGYVYLHELLPIDDSPSWADDEPEARPWSLTTACFSPYPEPIDQAGDANRLILDIERKAFPGDEASTTSVSLISHAEMRPDDRSTTDTRAWGPATKEIAFRGSGRTFQLAMNGNDRTFVRIGDMHVSQSQETRKR